MTATTLMSVWVTAATILMFCLIITATGWRVFRARRENRTRKHIKYLRYTERIIGWARADILLLATIAGVAVARSQPIWQAAMLGPSLWALIVIVGVVGVDLLILGRRPGPENVARESRIRHCIPWRLLGAVVLAGGLLMWAIPWAASQAASDQRSYIDRWSLDGVFEWNWSAFFPGWFYTSMAVNTLPIVAVAAIIGVVLVLARTVYRADTWCARVDQALRRRTIRDILLALLGVIAMDLAIMGLSVAWAFAALGPGSQRHAVVSAAAIFVGACAVVLTFWVFAHLLFLPGVKALPRHRPKVALPVREDEVPAAQGGGDEQMQRDAGEHVRRDAGEDAALDTGPAPSDEQTATPGEHVPPPGEQPAVYTEPSAHPLVGHVGGDILDEDTRGSAPEEDSSVPEGDAPDESPAPDELDAPSIDNSDAPEVDQSDTPGVDEPDTPNPSEPETPSPSEPDTSDEAANPVSEESPVPSEDHEDDLSPTAPQEPAPPVVRHTGRHKNLQSTAERRRRKRRRAAGSAQKHSDKP